MSLIQLEKIEKYYNKGQESEVHALNEVSLYIRRGEMVALMGVSGSGKSSLLHILGLLDSFDEGTYLLDGKDVKTLKPREQATIRNEKIGFIMQNFGLVLYQTSEQNVSLPLLLSRKTNYGEIRHRSLRLLRELGIREKAATPVDQLSGGQQQRVAIARALALNPDILCFDEPTSALDPELTGEVLSVIRSLASRNTTMIIVTHEMQFARQVADNVLFMDRGVVVEYGVPADVIDNPQNERTRKFLENYNNT